MKPLHFLHWTEDDKTALDECKTFGELTNLALKILNRYDTKVNMVSGPISTGGTGNKEDNMKIFRGAIEYLNEDLGLPVISQIPYQQAMGRLHKDWKKICPDDDYCFPILHEFYEGVFSSGKVEALHFIHGYESSYGARWEHDGCDRWGIKRFYLTQEDSQKILEKVNNGNS